MNPGHYRFIVLAAVLFSVVPALAGEEPFLPEEKARAVKNAVEAFVESRRIAGAVVAVAQERDGSFREWIGAVGQANRETRRAMTGDNLFWIASMTKVFTACAILMLVDEGRVKLDESVAVYLPEFSELKDAEGHPAEVTIRHLLTHTSGISGGEPEGAETPLAAQVSSFAALPLRFAPESKWKYCNSGYRTLGRVVETVSGRSYEQFLEERLFRPLGMKDTTFYPTAEQAARIAVPYTAEGRLRPAPCPILRGKSPGDRARGASPSDGLFSTASDLLKFCRMILGRGEANGRRFLSAESLEDMTRIQTGEMKTGFTDGTGWGLGWCVIREPQGVTRALSPGSFGHGGAMGTQVWVDPVRRLVHILLVQWSEVPNSDASALRGAFHDAVSEGLPLR